MSGALAIRVFGQELILIILIDFEIDIDIDNFEIDIDNFEIDIDISEDVDINTKGEIGINISPQW